MYPDIQSLLYEAEDHYLQSSQIQLFQDRITSLGERLKLYEYLRDQELTIFQAIANQLLEDFPNENSQNLERALKDWLSVMRYCSMAMLLNNPDFLQYRLLEWLKDIVKANQMESLENALYQLLEYRLAKTLSEQQLALIQPCLKQAKTNLLTNSLTEVGGKL